MTRVRDAIDVDGARNDDGGAQDGRGRLGNRKVTGGDSDPDDVGDGLVLVALLVEQIEGRSSRHGGTGQSQEG